MPEQPVRDELDREELGASFGPGSRPSDQANLRCPDAPRVDPSRAIQAVSLTKEYDEELILLMLGELHANVPEDQRPMSMSDLSHDQAERTLNAVLAVKRAVVTEISKLFRDGEAALSAIPRAAQRCSDCGAFSPVLGNGLCFECAPEGQWPCFASGIVAATSGRDAQRLDERSEQSPVGNAETPKS